MGWTIKIVAVFVGLISLTLGLWPVWLLCFGYLGYSLWRATRRPTVVLKDERGTGGSRRRSAFKKRYAAAGVCFVLSLVALADGGSLSPLVFAAAGGVIIVTGILGRGPSFSEVKPVENSTLLRSRWLPHSWVALAEVRFATPRISRALSSIRNEIIVTTDSGKASVYLPIRVQARSASGAEKKVATKLAPLARILGARGAYVLPLDSNEAATRMDAPLDEVELQLENRKDGLASLRSAPFDVLVLAPAGHMLESAAAYVVRSGEKPGRARIPARGRDLESQPLMWEALEALGQSHLPQVPDALTNFLSTVCATRGEGVGERLVNGGETGSGTMLVSSLGATQVELTRPQLRMIVSVYG